MADMIKGAGPVSFFAAVLIPPAVSIALGQSFIGRHPALAIAIGLGYVAIPGIVMVVTNDLLTRWRPLIVDHFDHSLRRHGPRFERRYRQFTLAGLKIDQKGLKSVLDVTPALDAVFVDVALVRRQPQEIRPDVILQQGSQQASRYALGDILGREDSTKLAIVGAPGSGKTTLLQHVARQACKAGLSRRDRRDHRRHLPILLYLREHATAITKDPRASLPVLLRGTLSLLTTVEPPGWFEQKLADGECLVLFDGLDEVARPQDREKVAAWIELQMQAYHLNDFVVSSRPLGYQSARVEEAAIVQATGFSADQVARFIRNWYREAAVHPLSGEEAGADAEALASQKAEELLKRLKETPALNDLAVNPLLLTMIANLYWNRERDTPLPRTRARLYCEICEVVLGRRQAATDVAKKKAVLAGLAYAMMDRRVSDLSKTEVLAIIEPILSRASGTVATDGVLDDFLADVRADGLLAERDTDHLYAFAHKTFQEYLAAAYILEKGIVSRLSQAVNDDWWAEVTLFYADEANADPIIRACLDAGTIPALALAAECVSLDHSQVAPDLRSRLDTVLETGARPDERASSAADRRRLAGILLSMHLRHRSRTSAGTQVCVRPVPAHIYRLFLTDTQGPEPDADPAILQARGTAIGMRSGDALAFASWANAIIGGQSTYRLPVASELDDLAAQERILALPSGGRPAVWALAGNEPAGPPRLHRATPRWPPIRGISKVSLTAAVEDDLAEPVPVLGQLLLLRSELATRLAPFLLATYYHKLDATFDVDPGPALTTVLALGSALTWALGLDLAPTLVRSQRVPFDHELALTLTRDRTGEINFDSAVARTREFDLAVAYALARDFSPDPALALDSGPPGGGAGWPESLDALTQLLFETLTGGVGQALSWALEQARQAAARSEPAVDRFAEAFASYVEAPTASAATVNPDQMRDTLQRAVNMLEGALAKRPAASGSVAWASAVAERLVHNADPVFSRTERLTREKSTAIRLAALCLAAEADALDSNEDSEEIGDLFREVAVGITWLQKRAAGELPATEVIMLAVDDPPLGA